MSTTPERTSTPFLCGSCGRRSPFPLGERETGYRCQHCLGLMDPPKRKRRWPLRPSAGQSYYVDLGIVTRRRNKSKAKTERLLKVAERDGWTCQLCGGPVPKDISRELWSHRPSVDHIIRRRDGGSDAMGNLRLAHQSCNEYREGANVVPFAQPTVSENISTHHILATPEDRSL